MILNLDKKQSATLRAENLWKEQHVNAVRQEISFWDLKGRFVAQYLRFF